MNGFQILIVFMVFQYSKTDDCLYKENCANYTEYESYRNCIYKNLIKNPQCENTTATHDVCSNKTCCNTTCNSLCTAKDCTDACEQSCIETLPKETKNDEEVIRISIPIANESILDTNENRKTEEKTIAVKENLQPIANTGPDNKEKEEVKIYAYSIPKNNRVSEELQEKCCYIIGQRKCASSKNFPFIRCYHTRRKRCGRVCKSPIMHEQSQEICDQTRQGLNCFKRIIYIPQPQPRCFYQSIWPYVTCTLQQSVCCNGCYEHYNQPDFHFPPNPECEFGCYDDGFGMGPYYRKGPFFRPGFSHQPSCYQTGRCNGEFNPLKGIGYPQFTNPTDRNMKDDTIETITADKEVEKLPLNLQYNIYDQWGEPSTIDYVPKDVRIEATISEATNSQATISIDVRNDTEENNNAESESHPHVIQVTNV